MQEPKERVIDGKTFEIRILNVEKGRKVHSRAQKLLIHLCDEGHLELGIDPVAFAMMRGMVTEEELTFLCDQLAPTCTVRLDEERTLPLTKCMDEVFAGKIDIMFEWIVACLECNFEGYLAKTRGALKNIAAKVPASQAKEQSE